MFEQLSPRSKHSDFMIELDSEPKLIDSQELLCKDENHLMLKSHEEDISIIKFFDQEGESNTILSSPHALDILKNTKILPEENIDQKEIEGKSLPEYLVKLLRKNKKMKISEIISETVGVYDKLRKSNGAVYKSRVECAVKGSLYSDKKFILSVDGEWILNEEFVKYINEENQIVKSEKPKFVRERRYRKKRNADLNNANSNNNNNNNNNNTNDTGALITKRKRQPRKPKLQPQSSSTNQKMDLNQLNNTWTPKTKNNNNSNSHNNNNNNNLGKKNRDENEQYEKVFGVLDRCLKLFKSSPIPARFLQHPFDSFNGNESIDDITKHFDLGKLVGLFQCFDYFEPLINEALYTRKKNTYQVALEKF